MTSFIERPDNRSAIHNVGAFVVMLVLGAPVVWAAPPPQPASGGQLLQQVPAAPTIMPSAPAVTIMLPEGGVATPGEAFLVQHIEISGNVEIPEADIRRILQSNEGKALTLADLQRLANAISDLYHKHGYPFSQAYVPAQTIQDGKVKISVLEARYDSIVLRNRSRVRDFVARNALFGLKPGMPVEQSSLDRGLLLLSDLPSTEVKGTLRPGQTVGTSQLLVDVDPGPIVNGSISADDYGNAATGRARLGVNGNLDNPLRLGDVLSASVLTAGRGMNYGRVGYEVPLYGPLTKIETHVSALTYKIVNGSEVALDALGSARVAGITVDQILWRTTRINVLATLTYDDTRLRDEIDASGIHTDRHTQDWRLLLSANVNDRLGTTSFSATGTEGHVVFDNANAAMVDESSAVTKGHFKKYTLEASRLERITDRTSLYATVSYQGADKNIDVSEQFFVGGPNSVRAYDNGLASGSQGNSQTLELRQQLSSRISGVWQGRVFLDHAQLQLEKHRYSNGNNTANLSGTGVGLNWGGRNGWSFTSSLSTPVGSTPDVAGHRDSVRFWLQVQKLF